MVCHELLLSAQDQHCQGTTKFGGPGFAIAHVNEATHEVVQHWWKSSLCRSRSEESSVRHHVCYTDHIEMQTPSRESLNQQYQGRDSVCCNYCDSSIYNPLMFKRELATLLWWSLFAKKACELGRL